MVFKLVRKNMNKIPDIDKIVVLKSSVRFPIKLRKKKKGMYNYVNLYKDKNKRAFQFTDDPLTGYTILKNRISTVRRKNFGDIKQGIYDYIKEKDLYIINLNDANYTEGVKDE